MRLINADDIPYCNYDLDNYHSFRAVEDDVIADMPTIDPESLRPKGRWIDDHTSIVCSKCKAEYSDEIIFMNRDFKYDNLNYCPNCGAKMIE